MRRDMKLGLKNPHRILVVIKNGAKDLKFQLKVNKSIKEICGKST